MELGAKYRLVLVRHGGTEWNEKGLFCGWYDAELSKKGIKTAQQAAITLKTLGFKFDVAFTSVLKRAVDTLDIILQGLDLEGTPVQKSWRLNERHYGGLTGRSKWEMTARYGEAQVQIWRRSFDVVPPAMDEMTNVYYNDIMFDPRYALEPTKQEFPLFESLKHTLNRLIPFWTENIVPELRANKNVLIVGHGNSLRALVKHLDDISDYGIMGVYIPNGLPIEYQLDYQLKPIVSFRRLGDQKSLNFDENSFNFVTC